MRLAVFTNEFPTRVSTFFARDIRGLIDAGIDVEVFAIYPLTTSLWSYVPDLLNEHILPKKKVHHLTVTECFQSAKFWPQANLRLFLRKALTINAEALKFGPQTFLKSGYVSMKSSIWARRYPAGFDHILAYWGNYTATCANLFWSATGSSVPFSIFLHAGIDLYQNQVYLPQKLLDADNIITCSEFNRSFIKQLYFNTWDNLEDKIFVHHHGLDFSSLPFNPTDRPSRKVIAVGSLEQYKGFDYLVRAVAELKARGTECELQFIGDGKERSNLEKLVTDLKLSDRVTFRGWLGPDAIPNAMTQATMLVHPSPDLGDGVPNVIKESMAVGTPVIASRVAGIPELLGDGKYGVLVPPKDVKALADAIENLLENHSKREQYVNAARNHAKKQFDLWRQGKLLADRLHSTTRSKPIDVNGCDRNQQGRKADEIAIT